MKFIDFCSGIGGGRLGLTNVGYECIAFSEIDSIAIKTYKFRDRKKKPQAPACAKTCGSLLFSTSIPLRSPLVTPVLLFKISVRFSISYPLFTSSTPAHHPYPKRKIFLIP